MTAHLLALPLSAPIPGVINKKRVLLVDCSTGSRELRAEIMRKLGMEVDCAADICEARGWWRADLYNLVLINVENAAIQRDQFCGDIRRATPPQQLAFLVGKPGYLADAPGAELSPQKTDGQGFAGDVRAALAADMGDLPQRWGILEASRRISAVRSASNARTRAMRNLPAPPRDSEGRPPKREIISRSLDDLLREEMQ
ncbi:MAG TPA: response regulator [Candidatus Sulfotelmatobacter sp.]|nr:response regulator [Candidatus Sulfotelmatobacter sp.]